MFHSHLFIVTIWFHNIVPMVTIYIYISICFILSIITLICVTLTFKFKFSCWIFQTGDFSSRFHPASLPFSQWISMGIKNPCFPTEQKCSTDRKRKRVKEQKTFFFFSLLVFLVFLNWNDLNVKCPFYFLLLLLQWPNPTISLSVDFYN